jgi:hypothetical protein
VLGLPTLSEEYTSSVCHAFGDAMVVITGNIVTATEGLADVCDRMEWFAPGSSSTVAQFAGSIGSILTDMGAVVEELHEQGELTSHESG